MWVSKLTEEMLTPDIIDRLLFHDLEDRGMSADCIIVLGSAKATKYRVPVAAKAFLDGRASKVMLCGGTVRDFADRSMTEAEHMKQAALALGIPEEDLILENTSQNTVENLLCSLLELQRSLWLNRVSSILLVTTAYHMRRSLHIAQYLFPAHIRVYPCPANDSNTTRNNWMNTDAGLARVKAEAMNIVRCVRNGVIPDFEI